MDGNVSPIIFVLVAGFILAMLVPWISGIWRRYNARRKLSKQNKHPKPALYKPILATIIILGCYGALTAAAWIILFNRLAKAPPHTSQKIVSRD